MKEMLQEYGYTLDNDYILNGFKYFHGRLPTKGERRFYESIALYAVMAYQHGLEGGKLSGLLPFIKESAPAVTATETQGSPSATNLHENCTTETAAMQGGKDIHEHCRFAPEA